MAHTKGRSHGLVRATIGGAVLAAKRKKTNELRRRADGRYQRQITITDPLTGESKKVSIYGRTQEELDARERTLKIENEKTKRSEVTLGKWLNTA